MKVYELLRAHIPKSLIISSICVTFSVICVTMTWCWLLSQKEKELFIQALKVSSTEFITDISLHFLASETRSNFSFSWQQ